MAASGEIRCPRMGRSDGRRHAWGSPIRALLERTFGRSVVPTHILTVQVATILIHVSANIWLALRSYAEAVDALDGPASGRNRANPGVLG